MPRVNAKRSLTISADKPKPTRICTRSDNLHPDPDPDPDPNPEDLAWVDMIAESNVKNQGYLNGKLWDLSNLTWRRSARRDSIVTPKVVEVTKIQKEEVGKMAKIQKEKKQEVVKVIKMKKAVARLAKIKKMEVERKALPVIAMKEDVGKSNVFLYQIKPYIIPHCRSVGCN